jgi:hypothetical protein
MIETQTATDTLLIIGKKRAFYKATEINTYLTLPDSVQQEPPMDLLN